MTMNHTQEEVVVKAAEQQIGPVYRYVPVVGTGLIVLILSFIWQTGTSMQAKLEELTDGNNELRIEMVRVQTRFDRFDEKDQEQGEHINQQWRRARGNAERAEINKQRLVWMCQKLLPNEDCDYTFPPLQEF